MQQEEIFMSWWERFSIGAAERGWLSDSLIRKGIRTLLQQRLNELNQTYQGPEESQKKVFQQFVEEVSSSPIAVSTSEANQQHYEVPSSFFQWVLGTHLKYSSALWDKGASTLTEAEENMLDTVCQRAKIEDGMNILDLGCGWGSLSLWMARKFPNSQILGISNSQSQQDFIKSRCKDLDISNLKLEKCDINDFKTTKTWDRIVSIEMLEHVRNHRGLFKSMKEWVTPTGLMFIHVFCHHRYPYLFEDQGDHNWMGRYFFTGGMMPSCNYLTDCQDHWKIQDKWTVNGTNYQKTADAWLANTDARKQDIIPLFSKVYGDQDAQKWFHRWRLFFLACSELFGYKNGKEWLVGHYLFGSQDK